MPNEISNQIPRPCIEKPTIRIDMGIKLYERDNHVSIIAAKLDPVNYSIPATPPEEIRYDPLNLPPIRTSTPPRRVS